MDYFDSILVPHERLGVLIGERGTTRKLIEAKTGIKMEVDSESGEVRVKRTDETAAAALKALDIIKAIARGFSPEHALDLLRDDIFLKVIDLEEVVRNERGVARQRARLIGTEGKARRMLEERTGARISIYGNTVAIIGDAEAVDMASEAVVKIASGTPHGDVYREIQRRQSGWA
jgi:ribosomal RNA assembly protein